MAIRNTALDWEHLGSQDAYWAVLTDDRFRKKNLTDAARQVFFESGEIDIERHFHAIRQHIDADFAPRTALDFGCGVGRVLIPLARRVDAAVGVDISTSMLAEARINLRSFGLAHVDLVQGDDELTAVAGPFDFIHSFIVFQHIPVVHGMPLLRRLVDLLSEGGVGCLHVTYAKQAPPPRSLFRRLRSLGGQLLRCIGVPFRTQAEPLGTMQMYEYPLQPIFQMLQEAGVGRLYLTYTNHGGCYGVMLHFQKPGSEPTS